MKRFAILAVCAAMLSFVLAACSTTGQSVPTPAQIAERACPLLTDELGTLALAGVFTGGAQDTLTKDIQPAVDKACAGGALPTQLNLQSLSTSAVPLLIALVKASSLADADKKKAILAIGTSKAVLDTARVALAPPAAAEVPAAATVPAAK